LREVKKKNNKPRRGKEALRENAATPWKSFVVRLCCLDHKSTEKKEKRKAKEDIALRGERCGLKWRLEAPESWTKMTKRRRQKSKRHKLSGEVGSHHSAEKPENERMLLRARDSVIVKDGVKKVGDDRRGGEEIARND